MPPKRAPRAQPPLKGGASKGPFCTLAYIGAAVCILIVIASMSFPSRSSAPSKEPSSSPSSSSASQPAAHPAPGPDGQLAEQMRINRSTQKAWHLFASHRARVQSVLLGLLRRIEKEQRAREKKGLPRDTAPSDGHSLCVLGAGNSNDLDLAALTGTAPLPESEANKKRPPAFAEVHLVDLDGESLLQGVRKQFERMPPLPDSEQMLMRTVLHGAVDLMGLLIQEDPSKWRPSAPADNGEVSRAVGVLRQDLERPILAGLNVTLSDELFARLQTAAPLPAAEPGAEWGNFSVVLSACLVTQFYEQVGHSLGFQHAGAAAVMAAVRARHLASMMQALRPGGWGLLVSDMVSSLSWPELDALPDDPDTLLSAMKEQADKKNHFHMSHPWRVLEQLEDARSIYSRWIYPGSVALLKPWKWRLSDSKTYLVFAIEFQRRHIPGPSESADPNHEVEAAQDAPDAEPAHSEL